MVQLEDKTYQDILQSQKSRDDENARLKAENLWLKEQLGLVKRKLFAPSSEQSPPPEGTRQEAMLFDEAEACASPVLPDPQTEVITYTRRKTTGQRELLVENLRTEEIEYTLPEAEQVCPECSGHLHEMGHDVRREVKVIPAEFVLVLHKRAKYACRHCERNEIKTPILSARMPKTAFPGSLASPSSVAYIMSQKYVEGSPLYRQEQYWRRLGFDLSRQTMANWVLTGAGVLKPIYDRMKAHLLSYRILHADETRLQVLHEEGRTPQSSSFMWLYHTGRDGPPIAIYEYKTTRAREHPHRFLNGFSGHIHVDGYVGYEGLPGVTLVGCWSHARRKFVEAVNVVPPQARKKGESAAHAGLRFCDKLFAIERDYRDATPEDRQVGRDKRSRPVLADMRVWLDGMSNNTLAKSVIGEAVSYCCNQWVKLNAFLEDGRLELDNNRAERAIKPFVIGRKNWLFANSVRGANASAMIYSIVETAKLNGLNPAAYLTYLFEQLPNIDKADPEELNHLMPWADPVQKCCGGITKTAR